jgi:hypothetical protein
MSGGRRLRLRRCALTSKTRFVKALSRTASCRSRTESSLKIANGLPPARGHTIQIFAEDRAQHRLSRELAGFAGNIDLLAACRFRFPSRHQVPSHSAHHVGDLRDHSALKGRLHHAPLQSPKTAVAGDDAVAGPHFHPLKTESLDIIRSTTREHVLDVIGLIEDIRGRFARAA